MVRMQKGQRERGESMDQISQMSPRLIATIVGSNRNSADRLKETNEEKSQSLSIN